MSAWCVEGAEGQGCDQSVPESSARGEPVFGVSCQKVAVVVEPPFRFQELEEEQSCHVDQGERASVVVLDACRPAFGDVGDMLVQCPEEPAADRVSAQQVVPAQAGQCGVAMPGCRKCGDRLGI